MTSRIGYKMTRPDGASTHFEVFNYEKTKYAVGKTIKTEEGEKDGNPCGVGIHLGKSTSALSLLKWNGVGYPWRLFKCEYDPEDVLGEDVNRVRVSALIVIGELRPFADLEIENAEAIEQRVHELEDFDSVPAQTPAHRKKIKEAVIQYIEGLNFFAESIGRVGKIPLKTIKFYSIKDWRLSSNPFDSFESSLHSSFQNLLYWRTYGNIFYGSNKTQICDTLLRSSFYPLLRIFFRSSLWFLIYHSLGYPAKTPGAKAVSDASFEILMAGAVLVGITNDGTAHVVMPTKDEIPTEANIL